MAKEGADRMPATGKRAAGKGAAPQSPRDVPVTRVMGVPVISLDAHCSAASALREMLIYGVRHLVVVDRSGRATGVIADRVLAAYWAKSPDDLDRVDVGTMLTGDPPVVRAEATVGAAALVMRDSGADAVVVVDGLGRPLGMLTTTDLISLLARADPEQRGRDD